MIWRYINKIELKLNMRINVDDIPQLLSHCISFIGLVGEVGSGFLHIIKWPTITFYQLQGNILLGIHYNAVYKGILSVY